MTAPSPSVASAASDVGSERWAFLRSQRFASIALLLPALLYLAVMTQAPFVLTLWYSFHNWILTSPELGHVWVGLDNYRYTLTEDPIFRTALLNTFVITAAIVGGSLVLGLCLALLLNRSFPLRGVCRALLIAPFFVMPTVNAVVQKNLFLNPIFGLVNWVWTSIGFDRVDWLAVHPKLAIITMAVWQWAPFMMLILLAGLQALNDEVREASKVDGASDVQEFRYIVLPHLKSYIQLGVLLGTIYILSEFDTIAMTTQGGPGTATTNLPWLIYQKIFYGYDVGHAAAMGVIVVALTYLFAVNFIRLLGQLMRGNQ